MASAITDKVSAQFGKYNVRAVEVQQLFPVIADVNHETASAVRDIMSKLYIARYIKSGHQ